MIKFVIDPEEDGDCYGKYKMSKNNIPEEWDDVEEVDNLDEFDVVEWRYW